MAHGSGSRPLSPHLQVYRWGLHMALSILNRATGVALGAGALMLAWWLMAIAAGPDQYSAFRDFATHWSGRLVLLGFTFSLVFHLLNGIRHLYWDTARGLEVDAVEKSGRLVILLSVAVTLGIWVAGYWAAGRIG